MHFHASFVNTPPAYNNITTGGKTIIQQCFHYHIIFYISSSLMPFLLSYVDDIWRL